MDPTCLVSKASHRFVTHSPYRLGGFLVRLEVLRLEERVCVEAVAASLAASLPFISESRSSSTGNPSTWLPWLLASRADGLVLLDLCISEAMFRKMRFMSLRS